MCLSVPTTGIWPNWILTYFFLNFKEFQNTTWVPTGVFAYVWTYLSLQLYVSVSLWLVCLWKSGHLAFSNILMIINWKKNYGLVCLSVPTTGIWPNSILTYFFKISKNFKTQHGSPQESLHMFELICPYNSMWVCHCDWCVSEKVAIWPFQIF